MSLGAAATPDHRARRIRQALADTPGGVLETIAAAEGASMRDVLACLPEGEAAMAASEQFEAVWDDLTGWGPVMFIVHTADGVFETKGPIPPGSSGRGYFNIHGDSPIGGHLRRDRCAAISFVDRPFFGRRSCSVQFVNGVTGVLLQNIPRAKIYGIEGNIDFNVTDDFKVMGGATWLHARYGDGAYYRGGQNQLIPDLYVGHAVSKGKDDPEDLFVVDEVVKGQSIAGTLEETGCKMTWPA